MLIRIQTQLTDLLASARSAIRSLDSILPNQRPTTVLVPVPVSGRPRPVSLLVSNRGYEAVGIEANAAVCMHAAPTIQAWPAFDFGTTKTGDTGHSQPSRFAT